MDKSIFGGVVNLKVSFSTDGQPVMHARINEAITVNGIAIDGYYSLALAKSGQHFHHAGSLKRAGSYVSLPWETKAYGKVRDQLIAWANELLHDPVALLSARHELARANAQCALTNALRCEKEAEAFRAEAQRLTEESAELLAQLVRMEGAV